MQEAPAGLEQIFKALAPLQSARMGPQAERLRIPLMWAGLRVHNVWQQVAIGNR